MDARFLKSNSFKNLGDLIQVGGNGAGEETIYCAGTTLRLDSPCFENSSNHKGLKRKWSPLNQKMELSLDLQLGNSSSSSSVSKGSATTVCTSMTSAKENEEESSMDLDLHFSLHLGGDKSSDSEKSSSSCLKPVNHASPEVDLQLSLFSGPSVSEITAIRSNSTAPKDATEMINVYGSIRNPSLQPINAHITSATSPCLSSSVLTMPKSSVTCTSGITTTQSQQQQRSSSITKQCQFQGCTKGARGASGLCIAHGGGRRCHRPGCTKGAEGRTAFCKAHGGGRRCEFLGCTKSAEGRTEFCIAHGGGRRCSREGCARAARGRSGLCIRHGGGKRCRRENCTKSAEGLSGLCISHGGGRRCRFPECSKGAQGSTIFCKAHGGGKRCTYLGCNKGAEGSTPFCKGHGGGKRCSFEGAGGREVCPKSVHGGTLFCVAHGGGKRCAVAQCTSSARGRTDFCVRHGGGKRCRFEGCGKSAQGSTDFCKAHGGGNRCSWGHVGSGFGLGDAPCESIARVKSGLCGSHGGGTVGVAVAVQDLSNAAAAAGKMKQAPLSLENVSADVVPNVGSSSVVTYVDAWDQYSGPPHAISVPSGHQISKKVPEGRVHGGNLLAMFSGMNPSGFSFTTSNAEPEKPFVVHQSWI